MASLPEGCQEVELSSLQLPQLESIQKQLNAEIDFLSTSCQQLKMVQQKFMRSGEAITKMSEESHKEVLIPLTESMYVPGRLKESKRVMVDIGTNYFVEMDSDKARDYFDRKVKFLTKQLEEVQEQAQQKVITRNVINQAFEEKLHAAISAATAKK